MIHTGETTRITSGTTETTCQKMPYVVISTQIRLEYGPTIVGDEWSDKELMEYLGATMMKTLGNNFMEYRTEHPPRIVLDKLEKAGYQVVAMTGVGQTCIWTLHKPDSNITAKDIQLSSINS